VAALRPIDDADLDLALELTDAQVERLRKWSDAQPSLTFNSPGAALSNPRQYTGLGLRKPHPSELWEVRIGLKLRVLFLRNEVRLSSFFSARTTKSGGSSAIKPDGYGRHDPINFARSAFSFSSAGL